MSASAEGRSNRSLLVGVFCSGAAIMIVEMTAVRALAPFFGATTWVWTNVIAVVMASLAVGYAVGGRLADRHASPGLLFGLLAAGGVLLVVISALIRPVGEAFLNPGLSLEGVTGAFARGSLGASLVLFAPAGLLLGTISPIAIRLLSSRGVGRAAGNVFALSTVGSIVGTYLPVFLLVPLLGSRGAVVVAAVLLLLPAAGGLLCIRRVRPAIAAMLLAALAAVVGVVGDGPVRTLPEVPGVVKSRVLREVESSYQLITVREDHLEDGSIHDVLTVNEGVHAAQSLRVRGKVLTGSRYYDDYALLPMLLDLAEGEELRGCIVGLACGVIATQWHHFWEGPYRLRVDGAEIDPEIVKLGREFFDLPGPDSDWLSVYETDGRRMLAAMPVDKRYHMIVVDAFANELYIPFHLGTVEFFELCRERLEPDGILAMNVYAYGPDSANLEALSDTLASVFGLCHRIRQRSGGNFILLAKRFTEGELRHWRMLGASSFSRHGQRSAVPPMDFTRLAPGRIRERFGSCAGLAEWEDLVSLAGRVPRHERTTRPREAGSVLTDDHAPLEQLTDRFLGQTEAEILR